LLEKYSYYKIFVVFYKYAENGVSLLAFSVRYRVQSVWPRMWCVFCVPRRRLWMWYVDNWRIGMNRHKKKN